VEGMAALVHADGQTLHPGRWLQCCTPNMTGCEPLWGPVSVTEETVGPLRYALGIQSADAYQAAPGVLLACVCQQPPGEPRSACAKSSDIRSQRVQYDVTNVLCRVRR
jgi:hypothetical protein